MTMNHEKRQTDPGDEKPDGDDGTDGAEPFGLEEQSAPRQPQRPAAPQSASESGGTLPLEQPEQDPLPCPQCGAPMPEPDALICIRCGYNIRDLEVTETRTGAAAAPADEEDDADESASGPPLSRPGRGDHWLPLTMAALAGLVLIIGLLAGASGLFGAAATPTEPEAEAAIGVGQRLMAVPRLLAQVLIWSGCGLAGLFLLAQMLQRTLGDLQLAAARMLGIVVTARLAAFVHVRPLWIEVMLEGVLQIAAFIVFSMLLFSLKPRDGCVLGGFALLAFLVLWIASHLVLWITI